MTRIFGAVSIAVLAAAAMLVPARATDDPLAPLQFFAGTWSCAGTFASGTPIASSERFEGDIAGTALVKHHADVPPGRYVALELWSYDAANARYRAVVEDDFGGVRIFTSPGWTETRIVWTFADPALVQSFTYEKQSDDAYVVTYRTQKQDGQPRLVDTLTCRRAAR